MMAAHWRITLLGQLRVEAEERTITRFRTQKAAALLAYLAYFRQQAHSREVLIELLWPELDLPAGRNNLSVALSSLRHQLEPPGTPGNSVLRADRFSVGLDPGAVITDVALFEARVQAGARAESNLERMQLLSDALALYQGPLLPGFYEEWITPEQERLAQLYFDAASRVIRHLEGAYDYPQAVQLARRLVSLDPLREDAHQALIRLLAAAGQPGAALRQYRALAHLLDQELGTEPSAAVRALCRRIEAQSGLIEPLAVPAPAAPLFAEPDAAEAVISTVTFLLTDVEGSTRLWEQVGTPFRAALESHHRLLRQEFARCGGRELRETGDSFVVSFQSARKALDCAVRCQQELMKAEWPEVTGPLQVRMALRTGDVEYRGGEYHGLALHRASRMLTAAHGGQVLLSSSTASLVQGDLPEDVSLLDLGLYRLRDVAHPERLFQVQFPGMPEGDSPPLRASAGHAARLPAQFTRFFGRENELESLSALILDQECRLVTLLGPGGTGKSRLAIEAAGRALEAYHGAVWFVPLADLDDSRLIPGAIVDAMGLPRSARAEPLDRAVEALARQPSLLVLDNLEQLGEGGAAVVQALLERLPSLKCLVTSRQVLALPGEREFPVGPLPTPNGPDTPARVSLFESVQLFIDRAQAVKPDFQVTTGNAAAVAELCDRLEGIPLAIELAAARAVVLTPAQMLAQLGNRFELLVTRRRGVAARHRTLRAAIDWSYRLLTPELQQFFARLSAFRGGWSVEAAEIVCDEPLALDSLAQLRECSLVLAEEGEEGIRFRMLETLRDYAAEQLAPEERETVERRHREYFQALAEKAKDFLVLAEEAKSDEGVWINRLDREHDNFRAALDWAARAGEAEFGLQLAAALGGFWHTAGYNSEGRERLARLLDLPQAAERTEIRAAALRAAGRLAVWQDCEAARDSASQALEIRRHLGDRRGEAALLRDLGHVELTLRQFAAAKSLFEEALRLSRDVGDARGAAAALWGLGNVAGFADDYPAASAAFREALAEYRELGDRPSAAYMVLTLGGVAGEAQDPIQARTFHEEARRLFEECRHLPGVRDALSCLGEMTQGEGDLGGARSLFEEALSLSRQVGDQWRISDVLDRLAGVALSEHDLATCRLLLEESLGIRQRLGDRGRIAEGLVGFAALAEAQQRPDLAARLVGAAEGSATPGIQKRIARLSDALREALGDAAFAAASGEGRAMSPDQAVVHALEAYAAPPSSASC